MEREKSKVTRFVARNRLNIAASTVAAVAVTAGAAAEKPAAFDPLTDAADSANHLVLKDSPHEIYKQIVDKLPEVDEAEAQSPPCNVISESNMVSCGWNIAIQSPDGSSAFVAGPLVPPGGSFGSVILNNGTHGDLSTFLDNSNFSSAKLDEITWLEYSTYSNSSGPSESKYPILILSLSTPTGPDELIFDPVVDNQAETLPLNPQLNTWQTWNARTGSWRSARTYGYSVTIAGYLGAFSENPGDVTIVNSTIGGIRLEAGPASTSDILSEYVDKFTIGINNSNSIYDFEPAGAPATSTPTETATYTPTKTATPTFTSTNTPTITSTPNHSVAVGGVAEMIDPKTLPAKSTNKDRDNGRVLAAEAIAAGAITVAGAVLYVNKRRTS